MKDNIGFRIFKNFTRPDKELVEGFAGIPTSNIGDICNRLSCMRHEIVPFNDVPLVGVAFTVKVPAGDNLVLHKALDMAQPGDIIVVDGEGCENRSLMGEMMITFAEKRGISGFIIDGAIRDVDSVRKASIPIYAKAVTPQGPYKNGPGEINVPIACGGQVVCPGDILVGDPDGIVVIKQEYARELLEEARAKHMGEVSELEKRSKETSADDMVRRHSEKYDKILEKLGAQYCE